MTSPTDRWTGHPAGPTVIMSRRSYGNLETITDSERCALRSIGRTAREVAATTGSLLADLLAQPGVRIFQGVRSPNTNMPRIPHAISAGRRLLLVESVAWPPGRYATTDAGRICCDGVYIGQSVRPLITAVHHWRETLPRGHRVSAVVIVHPTCEGHLALPTATGGDLRWTHVGNTTCDIRAHFPPGQPATSSRTVATLIAATGDEEFGNAGCHSSREENR